MDLSNRILPDTQRSSVRMTASGPVGGDLADDARLFVRTLRGRLSVILGTVAVITAIITMIAFQLPPRYTATTQILIDPQNTQILDLQSIFAEAAPEAGKVESQVHVIRSQALLERLVEKEKLVEDPEFNTSLKERGLISQVGTTIMGWVPTGWRKAMTVWQNDTPQRAYLTREDETARLQSDVVQEFNKHLRVARADTTFVLELAVTSASPTKAGKLANALADLYIVDQLETKFEASRRATSWLNEKLTGLRSELRTSEEAAEAFKAEHNLLGSAAAGTLNSQQLNEVHRNLVLARSAREEAEVRLQQIREIYESGGGIWRVANVITSDLITTLREEDAALVREEANLATRYQARHPRMVEIQSERQNVLGKMQEEVRRVIQELENNVRIARAREKALEGSLSEQTVKSADQNKLEIQLRALELEAESNRQIYEAFLSRFKSVSDQDEIQQSDARVISKAVVPRSPSFPNKQMVVAGGFGFSLLLGIFLALLVDRLDNGVRSSIQLESMTGMRNIAIVPMTPDNDSTPQDYVLKKPLSAYSEAIRALHNSIFLSSVENPFRVIVITSSLPDEGKSTMSLSLARLAARSGKRAILVDCDLRRPSVHSLLQTEQGQPQPTEKTIVDVLQKHCAIDDAIRRDAMSGLDILPARDGLDESPDLINSEQMRFLIKALEERYDLVIIDSPPVLPVGDALVLSRMADAVVYVVRWSRTPRDAVTNGLASLADAGANILGTALTQVDFERYTRSTYGDVGSYYRRYQGYYVD